MPGLQTVELQTEAGAIHCSACEHRIEVLLGQLPGVRRVAADHRTQRVGLALDPELTSLEEVQAKLEFLGFPPASWPAEEEMSTEQPVNDPWEPRAGTKVPHWDTVWSKFSLFANWRDRVNKRVESD
jgi:copper chaperone CopZ